MPGICRGNKNGNYRNLPKNASFYFLTCYLNGMSAKTISVRYFLVNGIKIDPRKIERTLIENGVKLRIRGKQGKKK